MRFGLIILGLLGLFFRGKSPFVATASSIVLLGLVSQTLAKWIKIRRRFARLVRSSHVRTPNRSLVLRTASFGAISNILANE